jgi:hypothetical protein
MAEEQHIVPVWFFVGVLLTMYGVIILAAGFREVSHPPTVVLGQYHSGIWGGILLLLIGGFYTFRFWPTRGRS